MSVELMNSHTTMTVSLPDNQGGILLKEDIRVIAQMTIAQMIPIVQEATSWNPMQPLAQRLEVVIDKNVDGGMQHILVHPVEYKLMCQHTNLLSLCRRQGKGMLPTREYTFSLTDS